MSYQIQASIMARLSDETQQQSSEAQRITTAWAALLEAVKGLPVEATLSIGPVRDAPVRRRRGRPRLVGHAALATGAEPPTAA